MSGSGGYFASLAPAMSKVLSPGAVLGVTSSEVSSSLSVSKETCAFILKNHDVCEVLIVGCDGWHALGVTKTVTRVP